MKTIIIEDNTSLFGDRVIRPDFLIKRENIGELEKLIVKLLKGVERNEGEIEKWMI